MINTKEEAHALAQDAKNAHLAILFVVNQLTLLKLSKSLKSGQKKTNQKKFKVSRMEYDMLQIYAINHISNNDTFNDFCTLRGLLDKGYFEGATGSMHIGEYYINCEVVDNDD